MPTARIAIPTSDSESCDGIAIASSPTTGGAPSDGKSPKRRAAAKATEAMAKAFRDSDDDGDETVSDDSAATMSDDFKDDDDDEVPLAVVMSSKSKKKKTTTKTKTKKRGRRGGSAAKTTTISAPYAGGCLYRSGIVAALDELKDRTGSTVVAIKRHMQANVFADKKWFDAKFLAALKDGVAEGDLVQQREAVYRLSAKFKKKRADSIKPMKPNKKAVPKKKAKKTTTKKPALKANGAKWNGRLEELRQYKLQHGNADVPLYYRENPQLGYWFDRQRREYKKMMEGKPSHMTEERVAALNEIGIVWRIEIKSRKSSWEQRFEELREYKRQCGGDDANRPKTHKPNNLFALGRWARRQQEEYRKMKDGKHSYMTAERVAALNEIGFDWENTQLYETSWEDMLNDLRQYKIEHGNTDVPREHAGLGIWVIIQRQEYQTLKKGRPSLITKERVAALNKIGFSWKVKKAA